MQALVSSLACFFAFFIKPLQGHLQINGSSGLKRGIAVNGCQSKVFYGNFAVDKFHRLQVASNSLTAVSNYKECALICVNDPNCSSFNVASSPRLDGKFLCESLNKDKYTASPEELVNSQGYHYYSIKTSCSSFPCQNDATCVPDYVTNQYHCSCAPGYAGNFCEIALKSCNQVYNTISSSSQLRTLIIDGQQTAVYCHMGNFGCGNGGWTTVMKVDGTKSTFNNDANYWTNKDPYNLAGGQTGFDSQETKLPTYWDTPFTKICLGMKIGSQKRFTLINKQASSFHSLIAQGQYHVTSLGRNTWKWLIGSQSSMQHSCNKEGFNVAAGENNEQKIRIGIFANQEDDCTTPDSKIGFGMGGSSSTNTCGNVANGKFSPDNGDKNIRAIGYILVQ